MKPDDAVGGIGADTLAPPENGVHPSLYVQIADRAYYIWLEKGMPEVGAWDFWLQAETEVLLGQQDGFLRRKT